MFLFIIFFILSFFVLLYSFTNLGRYIPEKKMCLLWGIFFFFLSFLRWEIGADWKPYYDYFMSESIPSFETSMDFGYQLLSYYVRDIFGSYTVLLFVQGSVISLCTMFILLRYTEHPLLGLLAFWAIGFAGIYFVRQNVAIAICFMSFYFIEKRKFVPFLILVMIASTLHLSALIFIFAYPFYKVHLSGKKTLYLLSAVLFLSFFFEIVLQNLSFLGIDFVVNKIESYIETGGDPTLTGAKEGVTKQFLLIKAFLSRAFVLIVSFALLRKQRMDNKNVDVLLTYAVIGTCIYCLCASVSVVLARMSIYYEIFLILLFSYWNIDIFRRSNRLFITIFLIAYLLVRLSSGYNVRPEIFAPYKSVFEKNI